MYCIHVYWRFQGASTSQVIGARNEWWVMITMAKWYLGTLGPKASWHLSYRWGKTPKKPHPGNLSRPGIEPGPAAWQRARYHVPHELNVLLSQKSQAARRLATGWTAHVQLRVSEGWRFSLLLGVQTDPKVHSASYKMSTVGFPGCKSGRA